MRTIFFRSLQALAALSTVVLLTGANDAGCGLSSSSGATVSAGTGGATAGGGGATTTTTGTCPDGTAPQWVCAGAEGGTMVGGGGPESGIGGSAPVDAGLPPPPCMGADCPPPPPPPCMGANCPPPPPPPCMGADCPPPPSCSLQCVPTGTTCPQGSHAETVCGGPPPPPPPPQMDAGPGDPPPPSMGAGPSSGLGGGSPGACSTVCVPDNLCPPGTIQGMVCTSPGGGMGTGGAPGSAGECWNQCVPSGPGVPPKP